MSDYIHRASNKLLKQTKRECMLKELEFERGTIVSLINYFHEDDMN